MSLTKNEIKLIKSLQIKKYRDSHGLFIIEGEKMISELLTQSKFKVDTLFYTDEFKLEGISNSIHKVQITAKELDRISGLKSPNKVLATVKMLEPIGIDFDTDHLVLLLDDIKDPGNLGTIIRTADWFGVKQIIASEKTVDIYNPKTIQSSMGAVYRIQMRYQNLESTIETLKTNDFIISGASLTGKTIYDATFTPKTALVMGNESHGISTNIMKQLDQELLIPRFGKTESLNVSIATGIFLAEYCRHINV